MLNKKGQMDYAIVSFIAIVIGIFLLGPILLKVVGSTLSPFTSALNSTNPTASAAGSHIQSTFTDFWDVVLISAFLVMIILMFISAFMIDTHPIFMIVYIMVCFLMILFLPNLSDMVQQVWGQYPVETNSIPMTQWLLDHISGVTLVLMVLSGIVMYAKLRSGNG